MRGGKQLLAAALLMTVAGAAGAQVGHTSKDVKVAAPAAEQTPPATQTQPTDHVKLPSASESFLAAGNKPPLLSGMNAANAYLALWDTLPPDGRHAIDGEATDSSLAQHQEYIKRLVETAMMDQCDWGLNYEAGFDLLMPQLGIMRSSARTLMADATRLESLSGCGMQVAEYQSEATRRVKAAMHMSQHVRNDRILISGLVGAAMNSLACGWVQERLQSQMLSTESAVQVLSTMRTMNESDLFGMHEAVRGEWDIMNAMLASKFAGEEGPRRLSEYVVTLSRDGVHPADEAISKMTRKEFDDAIVRMQAFYADSAAAWDKADAQEQLSRLATAVASGEYGPVATRLAAVLDRAWSADKKARDTFATTKKMLEAYIQNDGKMPAEMQKPAAEGDVR
jgi:hypothetical protein